MSTMAEWTDTSLREKRDACVLSSACHRAGQHSWQQQAGPEWFEGAHVAHCAAGLAPAMPFSGLCSPPIHTLLDLQQASHRGQVKNTFSEHIAPNRGDWVSAYWDKQIEYAILITLFLSFPLEVATLLISYVQVLPFITCSLHHQGASLVETNWPLITPCCPEGKYFI